MIRLPDALVATPKTHEMWEFMLPGWTKRRDYWTPGRGIHSTRCARPMRDGFCALDDGHRGRCTTVANCCDGCGWTRSSIVGGIGGDDDDLGFCWWCCSSSNPANSYRDDYDHDYPPAEAYAR